MADLEKFWDGWNNIIGDLERLKSKLEDGLFRQYSTKNTLQQNRPDSE